MRLKFLKTYLPFFLSILLYNYVSKRIFDNVYLASKQIIDEEFHLPQGLAYCNFHFDVVSNHYAYKSWGNQYRFVWLQWNPKITTLPGLYLISTLFLAPFDLCLIYWLRFMNYVASVMNFNLFYILFKLYDKNVSITYRASSIRNIFILVK